MSKVSASKIFLAVLAVLVCAGMLQAQPATPLTATPSSITVSYVVPSGPGANVPVVLKSAGGTTFFLDSTTMPFWLGADTMSGSATPTGTTVNFFSTSGASTLAAGNYSASVHVKASGYSDLVVSVTLVVSDPTSTVSVSDATGALTSPGTLAATRIIHWRPGTAIPTETLNVNSSNQPISFTVGTTATTPASPSWLSVNQPSGIAYNFGSPITVSFLPDTLNNAVGGLSAGAVNLFGNVTITPASGSAQVITIEIMVDEPYAVATSLFPSQTPPLASGNLTVVVTGNYFGSGGGYTSATTVTLTYNGGATNGVLGPGGIGGTVTVASPTSLILSIPYQDNAGTPNPILKSAPATVTVAIQNGGLGTVQNLTLSVTTSPIIYEVTDAASLVEPAAGANPTFAPYELVTVFGANLLGGNAAVTGALDADSRYPNSLSSGGHAVTVTFNDHTATLIANAYLLYASDTQINALVPSGVLASNNTQVQIIVNYNAASSTAYIANVAPANPGVFTTGASGQGQGAILLSNYTVNSNSGASTEAAAGSTILVYLSGMGAPDSTSANTSSTKAAAFPAACIAAVTGSTSYMATVNTNLVPATLWTNVDGAVILASQITNGHFAPCFSTTKVTATIQGLAATVTYAGWVEGSVAGLYQVNLTVPAKATTGSQPILVTVTTNGKSYTSQAGVTVAIK